ncbi:unnamed protein product [Linum tenue]|uniref:C2H2-type domain-containing protein n=1 Tax=Linum tenue TaxID=586396 RepID=A0AAV0K7Z0_9ROSI|nr:unnamed protein product [Linum tenue]
MERHKCKLCFRVFPNGRSLGGHMKSHMAKLRLPPISSPRPDDDESSSSFSYSSSGEEEDELEVEQEIVKSRAAVYGLRENPRKSFRVADPEFSFAGSSSVVQDRESETESRNPTRRRSKRTRKSGGDEKKGFGENQRWIFDSPPAAAEQEPVSSVSDTSPEEDVAMCLVMLSRDVNWKGRFSYKSDEIEEEDEEEEAENGGEIKKRAEIEEEDQGIMERGSRIRGKKLKCEKCTKQFRSSQALGSHRRICSLNGTQLGGGGMGNVVAAAERIFRCPYCSKVFGSGQALGGHKRSHLNGGGSYPSPAAARPPPPPPPAARIDKNYSFLDLNFPAPVEDDEFSVVSDA